MTDHPPSPCVKVCALDAEQRHCVGCWRSTEDIAAWGGMSARDKLDALARAEVRRVARREQMREMRLERARRRAAAAPTASPSGERDE